MTDPCDVLVLMAPAAETARYMVENDRAFAQAVAMHRGRYARWECRR